MRIKHSIQILLLITLLFPGSLVFAEQTRIFEEVDRQLGIVSHTIPLPASWRQVTGGEYVYEGPNDIKVTGALMLNFAFSDNPEMEQIQRSQGQQVRRPMTIQQIVDEYLMPAARQYNSRLVSINHLPQVARPFQDMFSRQFSAVPMHRSTNSYGVEWQAGDGTRALTVVTVTVAQSTYSSYWIGLMQQLETPASEFDKAKTAWLNGLANYRVNERWLAIKNQQDSQRAAASQRQHQANMAAIRNAGKTSQSIGNTYSDILDSSHKSFMNRSGMNDVGHSRSVDSIHEQQVMVNPSSGQQYQVQGYYNQNYINSDGTYLGTDDVLYDPRTDMNMYDGQWMQLQPQQ